MIVARFDLTDFEWRLIQPLLPNKPKRTAGTERQGSLRKQADRRALVTDPLVWPPRRIEWDSYCEINLRD